MNSDSIAVKLPFPRCLKRASRVLDIVRENVRLTHKQHTLVSHRLLAFFAAEDGIVMSRNCRRF